jgi:DNA primase
LISQRTIEQIQNRIDIVEIVGGFVKLKKRGANYLGLCPFHNEKTPSFTVSPSKEIYKCFGCGKSGNTIGFIMEHEKYSYTEALRWLATKYNVEIEETDVSPEWKAQQQSADSLYIVNNFASTYFQEQLWGSEEGLDIGLSYLKERGFREDIIKKFQIGYSPDRRDTFAQTAVNAKYDPDYLQKAGLVIKRDDKLIDNYRGRIIFPVHNTTGKVIGFGARVIGKNDKGPKYINTPENEIYVKSKILYGSYFARQAIDKNDECYLVEGYTDVISLHQSGIENVVASGGTSLTTDQLRLIRKYTHNLTILYDGDSAGIKAALRGLDMALEEGLNVKVVLIPDGEDPDSYVSKIGSSGFIQFIQKEKKDVILFQLEVSLKEAGDDPVRKAALVNQIAETISRINKVEDFTRQQDYIKRCAELLRIGETGLNALVNKFIREKIGKEGAKEAAKEAQPSPEEASPGNQYQQGLELINPDTLHEQGLLRCLIEFGNKPWDDEKKVADHLLDEVGNDDMFDDPQLQKVFSLYKDLYRKGLEPGPKNFLYHEDSRVSSVVLKLLEFPYEVSPNWQEQFEMKVPSKEETYREDTLSTLTFLKLRKIRRLIEENQKDLEKPHTDSEQMVLLQTHQHLKDMEARLLKRMGTVIFR